jgi:CRP/FNR family transcriptional regulator, cyclic AMP receptor protein
MTALLIFCGTDFSRGAIAAADVAAALAHRQGAPLVLVHASEDPGRPEVQASMDAEAQRLRQIFPRVQLETRVLPGFADDVLNTLAQSRFGVSLDLIVIGATGRRTPHVDRLGTTAERVVEGSSTPVLVVREAQSFTRCLEMGQPLEVALADDGSMSRQMLLPLTPILANLSVHTRLIHITDAPLSEPRERARLTADLRDRMRFLENPSLPIAECELSARDGSRSQTLVARAAALGTNLLLLGNRPIHGPNRLWGETVTRGALYRARMNVLVVPTLPGFTGVRVDSPHPKESDLVLIMRQLDTHPFLRGVAGGTLAEIASHASLVTFSPGEILFREGEPATSIFLITHGSVALDVHIPGRSTVRVETVGSGSVLGFSWLFPPFRWHLDASALDRVEAVRLEAASFAELLDRDSVLDHSISRRLVRELYERLERVRLARLDIFKANAP